MIHSPSFHPKKRFPKTSDQSDSFHHPCLGLPLNPFCVASLLPYLFPLHAQSHNNLPLILQADAHTLSIQSLLSTGIARFVGVSREVFVELRKICGTFNIRHWCPSDAGLHSCTQHDARHWSALRSAKLSTILCHCVMSYSRVALAHVIF